MEEKKKVTQIEEKPKKQTTAKNSAVEVVVMGIDGAKKSTKSLPEGIFNVPVSDRLLAQYVRVYLTNQRQGTRKVKSRGEIASSTRKIYKQKGTGRARHGAKSAPIFVGGGVAFGPQPKEYSLKMNKKQKTKALLGSLSKSIKANKMFILNGADSVVKTKDLSKIVSAVFEKNTRGALLVYSSLKERGIYTSAQNLENIIAIDARILNAYEVLKAKSIAFTEAAMEDFINLRSKN
jgi:large subunit ribosomal protein L4